MDSPRPKKIIAAHQPVYLPFVGFFQKMDRADEFLFMDFVQLNRQSWQVRNRVKTRQGPAWLTVPVYVRGKSGQLIRDTRVVEGPWRRKHWETLKQSYVAAPYFKDYGGFFEDCYGRSWELLAELNLHLIRGLREFLGVTTPVAVADPDGFAGVKTDLVIDIVRKLHGDAYLSSDGESAYIEKEKFQQAGVRHYYLGYQPIPYPQQFGAFVPNLSAIDLLFNCGPASAEIIRNAAPFLPTP